MENTNTRIGMIKESASRSPGRIISLLYRKGQIYKNIHLKDLNITSSEQPFIIPIYLNQGVSQEHLSTYLNIDKASTTRAIQSLINKGLVEKVRCQEDKRQNKIYLTDKCIDMIDPLIEILDSWMDILTHDMSPQEKEMAYHYLDRMAVNVERIFNGTNKRHNTHK